MYRCFEGSEAWQRRYLIRAGGSAFARKAFQTINGGIQKMKKQSLLISTSTMLLLSLLLPACSSTPAPTPAAGNEAKLGPPTEISITTVIFLNKAGNFDPPDPNNEIQKELEKRSNTKLKINWVPDNDYGGKLAVLLAAGDLSDITHISNIFTPQFRTMVSQGAFWDISGMIKNYPNLMKKVPEESWNNSKQQDGKIYTIPKVRPLAGNGSMIIRKDWLDKLKLKAPTTMDELYAVAKAFTENDPDGNNIKDTIGFGAHDYLFVEQGFTKTQGDWALRDGKLINVNLLPETKQALLYLNKAYKEGLIPIDFSVMGKSKGNQLGQSGKAGIFADTVYWNWVLLEPLLKIDPKADFMSMPIVKGYAPKGVGFAGGFAISKSVPEAKVKKILEFLDYSKSDEGVELAMFGIKGRDFTEADGVKTINDSGRKAGAGYETYGQIFNQFEKYQGAYRSGIPTPLYERNKKLIDEFSGFLVPDHAYGLYSPADLKAGAEIKKKFADLKIKIILGNEPIEAWDKLVETYKNDKDLTAITTELNAEYKKK
jgi:putative aldouronate transport system substrate-binding protein